MLKNKKKYYAIMFEQDGGKYLLGDDTPTIWATKEKAISILENRKQFHRDRALGEYVVECEVVVNELKGGAE